MARETHLALANGHEGEAAAGLYIHLSQPLFLIWMFLLSLSIISAAVFACGTSQNKRGTSQKKRGTGGGHGGGTSKNKHGTGGGHGGGGACGGSGGGCGGGGGGGGGGSGSC